MATISNNKYENRSPIGKGSSKFIHFRKVDALTFGETFPKFQSWLLMVNQETQEYVNIEGKFGIPTLVDGKVVLKPTRTRVLPTLTEEDGDIYNMYFIDDIKVMYFYGVPYQTSDDFITGAEFYDEDTIAVDPSTHMLYLPRITSSGEDGGGSVKNLKTSYIVFKDINGLTPITQMIPFYSPQERTFAIENVFNSYRLSGIEGSQYALKADVVGNETDNFEDGTLTLNSLKNYMLTHGGTGGGGDYDDNWHSDEED